MCLCTINAHWHVSTEDRMKMVPSCRYEALHGSAHMCHAYASEEFFMVYRQESQTHVRVANMNS